MALICDDAQREAVYLDWQGGLPWQHGGLMLVRFQPGLTPKAPQPPAQWQIPSGIVRPLRASSGIKADEYQHRVYSDYNYLLDILYALRIVLKASCAPPSFGGMPPFDHCFFEIWELSPCER